MATYLLVHGTGCGGWIWKKLAPLLRQQGHEVYAPTLTGLADRKHLLGSGVNLTTHVTDVTNLILYEDLDDLILVGNSYGGMVITGVAGKIPERLRLLVYLDAYLPEDGQSEADLLPPGIFAARQAEAIKNDGLISPPPPALFGISDSPTSTWVTERLTPHPISTYIEKVSAKVNSADVNGVFIYCTANPPGTADLFAVSAMKARAKGWRVIDLETGHFAMLSSPGQLATILNNLAL